MTAVIELLFVAIVTAVVALAAIWVMGGIIEALPARVLPWSVLALVGLALLVLGAAAVVRSGRLP